MGFPFVNDPMQYSMHVASIDSLTWLKALLRQNSISPLHSRMLRSSELTSVELAIKL